MASPLPLPPALRGEPLTAAALRAHGVSEDRLRRRDIRSIGSGVYLERDIAATLEPADLLRMRARGVIALRPEAWVSHTTPAVLVGLPLPRRVAQDLHISVPAHRAAVRRSGVIPHQQSVPADELRTVGQLPVSSAERMFLECATVLRLAELIALGDALVRRPRPQHEERHSPYSSIEALAAYLEGHRTVSGHRLASAALHQVRVGADSAQETRMRLALVRAGLPEPELPRRADLEGPPTGRGSRTAAGNYRLARPDEVLGDKAYSSRAIRKYLRSRAITATIAEPDDQKRHRHNRGARGGRPPKFDAQDYKGRNIVERGFCHLKQWRGIATRYDKLATTFRAAALLHGVIAWIKHLSDTP